MRTSAIIGAAALCFSLAAGTAQAQNWRAPNPPPPPQREVWGVASWGQPAYRPYEGRDRNGRHEHETYRYGYGHGYGYGAYGHGNGVSGYSYRGHGVRQGYRDEWGYQDDRPHTARGYGRDSARHRGDHHDGCGCPDVYLYDR